MLTLCFVQAKLSHFQAHEAAAARYDAIVNGRNNEGEVDEMGMNGWNDEDDEGKPNVEEERFFLGGLFRPRPTPAPTTTTTQSPAVLRARLACVRAGRLNC